MSLSPDATPSGHSTPVNDQPDTPGVQTVNLSPYPADAEEPIGYVQARNRGKRIIIVIDDSFDLPNWYSRKETRQPPNAVGLKSFYDIVSAWDMSRAIGFFTLPDPAKLETGSHRIIDAIENWLQEVCCDEECDGDSHSHVHQEYRYYILVDFFYGLNATLIGHQFLDYWKERQILPSSQCKLAYLSTAGAYPGFEDPHDLPVFQKNSLETSPYKLKAWLDFEEVPLDKVWDNSVGWFDDRKGTVVKHDFAQVEPWFHNHDPKAEKYRDAIEMALGFQFPEAWWQDLETIKHIHESLKRLCGEFFCGNTNQRGCQNISVGAAYLIALKAHHEVFGTIDALACDPLFWRGCSRTTAAVFPLQDRPSAKSSAIALYDFFYHLFKPRAGRVDANQSSVKTAYFDQQGAVLKIQVNWDARIPPDDRPKSLAQTLKERFDSEEIEAPDPDDFGNYTDSEEIRPALAKNSRDAVVRLWRSLMFNKNGFLSPGVIYMERDEIIIASTEYLVSPHPPTPSPKLGEGEPN
jgi:hypothetical protein